MFYDKIPRKPRKNLACIIRGKGVIAETTLIDVLIKFISYLQNHMLLISAAVLGATFRE